MPVASLWDVASDLVDEFVDVGTSVVSVVSDLPGAAWVEAALKQGASWTKDFAGTDVGKVVLRAMASSLYGPLATQIGPWFGPQLATIVWAVPGLAKGDSFLDSWVSEFAYRTQKTAEILGSEVATAIAAQVKTAIDDVYNQVLENFPDLPIAEAIARLGLTPAGLAKSLGIREDKACEALSWLLQRKVCDLELFDLSTGKGPPPPPPTRAQLVAIAASEKYSAPLAKPLTRAQLVAIAASEAYTPSFKPLTRAQAVALSAAETGSGYARTAPALDVGGGAPDGPRKAAGDVLLVGVVTVAAGALVWFYVGERRGRS